MVRPVDHPTSTMHVCIIGAYGSAGAAAADRLVDAPEVDRLTLVDDGDPGGGLCILEGCMPSKEVLSAGRTAWAARHDDRVTGDGALDVDLERVVERKDEHVSDFAAHRRAAVHEMAEAEGVTFHHERAELLAGDGGAPAVRVGGETLGPDYVVVATGSTPNVPDLPGLDEVPYRTSADLLDATDLPESAAVMGFGYVGMELAPYIAQAGPADVTVVEHDPRPLDEADDPFGDALLDLYRDAFDIEVVTEAYEERVEPLGDDGDGGDGDEGVRLHLDTGEAIEVEELFLFTGRRPNLDGLGLEAAGITPGSDWVRDTMQARDADRVFVVGDANGKEPILHVAKEQGYTAAENIRRLARGAEPREYENTHHHVVFSGLAAYPYARVGHSAESAADAGLDCHAVTRQASDDGVFKSKAHPEGLARLVVGTDGTVHGYQGLHYHADVMAKTMQVVVETGLDVREVPDRAYHPTTPEILDGLFRQAAAELE
jgi:pyruvate/2-oxoglutarate dehydrogenase complex dihydrolipoamide dehydrogenase (E3) component